MSTPADWKQIVELGELATPRPWKHTPRQPGWPDDTVDVIEGIGAVCATDPKNGRYIAAACNAAPDMAQRLLRIAEILRPDLNRCNPPFMDKFIEQNPLASFAINITASEARELSKLLNPEAPCPT